VYVSDSSRDILRPFQLTIAEKEGLPAEERFNTRNHLVQFALLYHYHHHHVGFDFAQEALSLGWESWARVPGLGMMG
jgi:hypothetical protein